MFRRSAHRSPCHFEVATVSLIESLERRLCLSTFLVTNLEDSGAGSLRQAIVDANNHSNVADLVTFQPGLSGVISLNSSLLINDNLTISGPGAALITLRRAPAGPPFYIIFFQAKTLNLSGLTISRGGGNVGGGGLVVGEVFQA